jgi:hypothetical protein
MNHVCFYKTCPFLSFRSLSLFLLSILNFAQLKSFSSLYDHINLGLPTSTSWLRDFLSSWGGLKLSPLGISAINWTIIQAPDDRWEFGGMRIDRETEVLGENLPQHHFVHHKSHMTTWARTRAAAVGSRELIAWAMPRPYHWLTSKHILNNPCLIHSHTCPNHSDLPVFIFDTRLHGAESLRSQQLLNQGRNSENFTDLEDLLLCLQRRPLVCVLTQMNPVYTLTLFL